jgi:hypothetical protein
MHAGTSFRPVDHRELSLPAQLRGMCRPFAASLAASLGAGRLAGGPGWDALKHCEKFA